MSLAREERGSRAARPHGSQLDLLGRLVEDVVGVLEEHLVELGLGVEEGVDLARLHARGEVVHVAISGRRKSSNQDDKRRCRRA